MLLRQLSYAIRTQLKAPKAPYYVYNWRQQHIVNLGPHLRPRVGQLGLVRPSSGQLGAAGLGHLKPGQILEKLPAGRKQDRFWSGEEAGTHQGLSVAIKPRLQNTLGLEKQHNTEEHNIGESFIISFLIGLFITATVEESLLSFSRAEFCVLCESST